MSKKRVVTIREHASTSKCPRPRPALVPLINPGSELEIRVQGVNASKLVSINMLMGLWNERLLSLRDIRVDEHATRNVIITMAGGILAIATMKKRLQTQSNLPINPSDDRVSSSATMSNLPPPPRFEGSREGQSPERMLLHSTAYVRDVKVEISNLRVEFATKDKEITNTNSQVKILNASLAVLQEEQTTLRGEVTNLKEAKSSLDLKVEHLKKQISKLMTQIEILDTSVKRAERVAMDGVFDAEQNILDQIRLLAPDLDVSTVNAFKKMVDGKIVEIL
ncbi:uncharacterized protein DS421_5g143070 [Arachis hypogaea]|nr:uncharacterized protein DS421_5g143070 [Arachis hypogaea]